MNSNITHKDMLRAQREYMRAWRKRNRDKVKQYNRTYWQRVAERAEQKRQEETDERAEPEG